MGWRDDPWLRGFESGYGAGYRDALEGRDTRQGWQGLGLWPGWAVGGGREQGRQDRRRRRRRGGAREKRESV
jgi:hypothetical protein